MRYKEFYEATWSQRIGGPPTTGGDAELAQSQELIQQARQAYKQRYGRELAVNSTERTRQRQQDLFQRSQRGERGVFIAADPSKHPTAKYFHLYSMDISNLSKDEQGFLAQLGWVRPDPLRDPVHYQYAGKPSRTSKQTEPQKQTDVTMSIPNDTTDNTDSAQRLLMKHLKDMGLVKL